MPLPLSRQARRIFHFFSRDRVSPVPGPVDSVLRFPLCAEMLLATPFAVWDKQAGALVAAVGDDWCAPAGPVGAGLGKGPAVVPAARQGQADRHDRRLLASMTTCRLVEYR